MFWKIWRKKSPEFQEDNSLYSKESEEIEKKLPVFEREETLGHLVLIGGAEDKTNSKNVLRSIVAINNAKNIIVIPTASSFPRDLSETYRNAFKSLGVRNIDIFDIREKKDAENPEYFKKLIDSDLIFFTGGDQVKLFETLSGTHLINEVFHQYKTKGLTIAGTSAGAAAASNPLIYDGDGKGLIKGSIKTNQGFGLLPGITIDTHFHARRRLTRLSQSIVSGIHNYGIGLDEDTAIIVSPNNQFEVIGSGIATIINKSKETLSNIENIKQDEHFNINNINISLLQQGAKFDLTSWGLLN